MSVPLACGGEEGVVGGVLEQAAHEVGHAGDEVADRAVRADLAAGGGDRGLRVVAQPAQDLELEVLVADLLGVRVGGGVRRSSAGCGEAIATRTVGVASIRRLVSVSKLRSHSRRSVNTGGAQPFWAAWTTSWSQ